jgi:hypothetical protein
MARYIRRHVVLVALIAGLLGSAVGERLGTPNSWLWFTAGAVLGILIVLQRALVRARRRPQ